MRHFLFTKTIITRPQIWNIQPIHISFFYHFHSLCQNRFYQPINWQNVTIFRDCNPNMPPTSRLVERNFGRAKYIAATIVTTRWYQTNPLTLFQSPNRQCAQHDFYLCCNRCMDKRKGERVNENIRVVTSTLTIRLRATKIGCFKIKTCMTLV